MQRLEFQPAEHTDYVFRVIEVSWRGFLTLLGSAGVTGAIVVRLWRSRRRRE